MTTQSINQVQAWAVGRQPKDLDLILMLCQPLFDSLGVVEPAVVANQADFSSGVCRHQGNQEGKKVDSALRVGHGVGRLSGCIIDASIDYFLLVFDRRSNFRLTADRSPDACQGWMPVYFHFILKDQRLRSILD